MKPNNSLTKDSPSDNDKVLKKVIDFLSDAKYVHGELIIKRQNGKPVFMEMTEKTKL